MLRSARPPPATSALFLCRNRETAELKASRAFSNAELDAPVRENIEGRKALRRAGRMVVVRDHLADTVAEANVLR